jgi:putative flippase GtrA
MSDFFLKRLTQAFGNFSVPQFLLFALMGSIGTIFHYSILLLFVEYFNLSALIGSIVGSICGAMVNFVLSHQVVFRSKLRLTKTAPRFFFVVSVGLTLNAALMYVFVQRLLIGYLMAQLAATAAVLLFNYGLNSIWTFNKSAENPNPL